jgi:hypothetical protein
MTPPPGGRSRAVKRRGSLVRVTRLVCLAALVAPALLTFRPNAVEGRVRAAARPFEFHLVSWEAEQLRARLPALFGQLRRPPAAGVPVATAADASTVQGFFAAVAEWRRARAAGASADEVQALRAAWEAQAPDAQAAISRSLAVLASQQGLTTASPLGTLLLPPASFDVTEPPRVLVVSPRERVEVAQSILLRPDVTRADAEALEREVDELGVSSLVIAIGGIATYPAIVPLQASPVDTLSAVAHEWLHGYLFFQPLGRAYFASYDARTLNETVANLGGRELGRLLAAAYGLPTSEPAASTAADNASGFNFRQEMQATRQRLNALLTDGHVEEAEQYLEARRHEFVAAGYPIRKLNQAYFAFNGSYGDSPAAVSPLDGQVRALRADSPNLGAFLRRVGQMTSSADVAAAVGDSAGGS